MKKFFTSLSLVLLLLSGLMLLVSCSDDDGDSGDGGGGSSSIVTLNDIYTSLNFSHFVAVVNYEEGYGVMITPNGEDTNNLEFSYELEINGEEVYLVHTPAGSSGSYDFVAGDVYQFVLKVNDVSTSGEMKIAAIPSNPFPDSFDPATETPLSWTLSSDSDLQFLDGYSYANDDEDEDYKEAGLQVSARQYSIPANWLNDFNGEVYEYEFSLFEVNYSLISSILFLNVETVDTTYYLENERAIKSEKTRADRKDLENVLRRIVK